MREPGEEANGVSLHTSAQLQRKRERRVARRSVCIAGFRVSVGVRGGPRACWWGGNPSFVSKEVECALDEVNEKHPRMVRVKGWKNTLVVNRFCYILK